MFVFRRVEVPRSLAAITVVSPAGYEGIGKLGRVRQTGHMRDRVAVVVVAEYIWIGSWRWPCSRRSGVDRVSGVENLPPRTRAIKKGGWLRIRTVEEKAAYIVGSVEAVS